MDLTVSRDGGVRCAPELWLERNVCHHSIDVSVREFQVRYRFG
jgi:hypothetical protein